MKKLFSLVLMSFSTVFITMNETSCFCQRNNKKKTDLSTMTFTKSTAITNKKLYDSVYEQIGQQTIPVTSKSDIQNDNLLDIKIQDETSADISYDTNTTHQATYNILITVHSGDLYFADMEEKKFTIVVEPDKTDLSTYTFTEIYATNGADIYNSIAEQLADVGGTTVANITQDIKDGNIIIKFTDSASVPITDASTTYTGGNCTINLQILANDIYFKQLAAKDYPVVAVNVVDISLKTFDQVTNATVNTQLFLVVNNQMGSWAIPTVTGTEISADNKITVKIYNPGGQEIANDGGDVTFPATYTVKIKIDTGDAYFKPMNETIYDLPVIF